MPLNKSIVTSAVQHVAHVMQVKLLHFGQNKVGYHFTVALTIHSYVRIRRMLEEVRCNDATSP